MSFSFIVFIFQGTHISWISVTFLHCQLHFFIISYISSLSVTFIHYQLHLFTISYIYSLSVTFIHYQLHFFIISYISSLSVTFLHYHLQMEVNYTVWTIRLLGFFFHRVCWNTKHNGSMPAFGLPSSKICHYIIIIYTVIKSRLTSDW